MSDASNFTYDIFTSWIFFAQPKLVKLESKEYRRPKCFRKILTQKIINSEKKTTQKVLHIYFFRLVGGGRGVGEKQWWT
jgi:hypothetical protein